MDYYASIAAGYTEPDLFNEEQESFIGYHNITHDDMKNGDGLRVVLWVAGCEHHCAECHNPVTWDNNGGIPFTPWEEAEFWDWLKKPWTQGATFSGGDPLHPRNRNKIGQMAKTIKEKYPEKDIWVYTGYDMEAQDGKFLFFNRERESFELPWLSCIDVLVDGRFDADRRRKDIEENKTVHWRGSSNQHIIDIQESIRTGRICVMDRDK